MIRENHAHLSLSSFREQWFERARRTQFHIEIFRVLQESRQQIAPFLKRQIAEAAFPRVTRGDDDRRLEFRKRSRIQEPPTPRLRRPSRQLAFELIDNVEKTIESNFKKIRRLIHGEGKSKIGRRGDDANEKRAAFFDRSARCHILSGSNNDGRAMIASL